MTKAGSGMAGTICMFFACGEPRTDCSPNLIYGLFTSSLVNLIPHPSRISPLPIPVCTCRVVWKFGQTMDEGWDWDGKQLSPHDPSHEGSDLVMKSTLKQLLARWQVPVE